MGRERGHNQWVQCKYLIPKAQRSTPCTRAAAQTGRDPPYTLLYLSTSLKYTPALLTQPAAGTPAVFLLVTGRRLESEPSSDSRVCASSHSKCPTPGQLKAARPTGGTWSSAPQSSLDYLLYQIFCEKRFVLSELWEKLQLIMHSKDPKTLKQKQLLVFE